MVRGRGGYADTALTKDHRGRIHAEGANHIGVAWNHGKLRDIIEQLPSLLW
jgi:hypothetical protein